jgi:ABC-type thiamin/hydroxymethylpyrimidine transport system permease subunit
MRKLADILIQILLTVIVTIVYPFRVLYILFTGGLNDLKYETGWREIIYFIWFGW